MVALLTFHGVTDRYGTVRFLQSLQDLVVHTFMQQLGTKRSVSLASSSPLLSLPSFPLYSTPSFNIPSFTLSSLAPSVS